MTVQLKKSGAITISMIVLMSGSAAAGNRHVPPLPSMVPADPVAGECYARVKIPGRYETRSQTVLVEDGYSDYRVDPEHFTSRTEQVMVKEPSVEYRVRQPRYRAVTEQIMVRPAYDRLIVSAPRFKHVTESVQVTSARLIWKKGNPGTLAAQGYVIHSTADGGPGGSGYRSTVDFGLARDSSEQCGATCEIWCLVEEPGQSVSYNRKIMVAPSQVHRVPVSAKYQSITKQVLADPGGVEQIPIPAKFQSVIIEDVYPGSASLSVHRPDTYREVAVSVPVENERYEWRRVVCNPGTHPGSTGTSALGGIQSSGYTSSTVSPGVYSSETHTSGSSRGASSSATGTYVVATSPNSSTAFDTYGTVPVGGTYGHDSSNSADTSANRTQRRRRR